MIEDGFSILSYEIRSSLTTIWGFSAKLCRDAQKVGDDERERWAHIIKSACCELADKTDAVLIASSLDKLGESPEKNIVNLRDFIRKTISDAEVYAKEGSDIVYNSALSQDLEISVNAPLLEAALLELLKNALQHISGGHVILKTELSGTGDWLLFSVSDCGPGIPAEHRNKIFEWYYKIDPFKPGLGVGLPLCKEIAYRLGGDVILDSDTTISGTTMYLTIPF